MEKWADFLISAVHYEGTTLRTRHITALIVHQDNGNAVGIGAPWNRMQVVAYINGGYSFKTTIKSSYGKWEKGEDVRVFTINGIDYLRTDANRIAKDNLENLPEI